MFDNGRLPDVTQPYAVRRFRASSSYTSRTAFPVVGVSVGVMVFMLVAPVGLVVGGAVKRPPDHRFDVSTDIRAPIQALRRFVQASDAVQVGPV